MTLISVIATATPATPAAAAQPTQPASGAQPAVGNPAVPAAEEKVVLSHPPAIPVNVLRFVVNILTAGECSGRTFSHSLALIQHLAFIPDAREVIAQELSSRAQEFGLSLCSALDELATALKDSRTDDVTRIVASKFSPASADQAKLLRILKALDYLFDPKRDELKAKIDAEEQGNSADPSKADLVTTLYENATFSLLWDKLSECLRAINQSTGMLNVAAAEIRPAGIILGKGDESRGTRSIARLARRMRVVALSRRDAEARWWTHGKSQMHSTI